MISNCHIDKGRRFDWGRTSPDYAKYRDIYPQEMYDKILSWDLCRRGQEILDLGTGTGVFPRNMHRYGASFVGTDISEDQIKQAKILSEEQDMDIRYIVSSSETLDFPENSFDAVTAFTCFFYFNHSILMPKLQRFLKPDGHLLIGYMSWLPFEDKIAGESEKLILKYNPDWSGANETRRPSFIPECYFESFEKVHEEFFDVKIPFTRESWNGRIKACRGIGASLPEEAINEFEKEHLKMLSGFGDSFEILHNVALTDLRLK